MTLELRIVSGQRAGVRERFDKSVVSVGRHPLSDLRFDPYQELDVSTRHAELRGIDGVWTIRDEQSTNGTFVNGQRVEGEKVVRQGDLITFGANGPRVEVHVLGGPTAGAADLPVPTEPTPVESSRAVVEQRLLAAMEAQARMFRMGVAAVMAMMLIVIVVVLWRG